MAEKATAKEEDPAEQQALAEGPAEDQTPTEAVVEAYEAKVRLPQYNVNARVLNIKIIKNNIFNLFTPTGCRISGWRGNEACSVADPVLQYHGK